ncbi:hypothetical protein [Embleya sp. NPDC005575]
MRSTHAPAGKPINNRAAGLVAGHRVGREVRYARTRAAETLLGAAGSA